MKRKEKLLQHYVDTRYRLIKYIFPMLTEEFDIKDIKDDINSEDKIRVQKNRIDNIFKEKICDYLTAKYDIAKMNYYFYKTNYSEYEFDYELSDKLLWFTNYKWERYERDYPDLAPDLTIEDSKNLVREFYKDLLKDNPNDINVINYLIDNKLNIIYSPGRAITNTETKEINITYNPNLSFLIILVHELAHAYAYYKKDRLLGDEDVRCVEIESAFIEKLFMKYLMDKKYPIIYEENKLRPVNKNDLDTYNASVFYSIITYAFNIIDEYDMVECIGDKDRIDKEVLEDFVQSSPYEHNYIAQASYINDILNNYVYDEYQNATLDELNDATNEIVPYIYNELESFLFSVRYVYSFMLSTFFMDTLDDERTVKYFKEFLNNKNDYSISDVSSLIGFEIEDSITLPTIIFYNYYDIMKRNNIDIKVNPYIVDDYIKTEKDYYKKLIEKAKNSNRKEQDKEIYFRKLCHLFNSLNISLVDYPHAINSQLDDCDIEEIEVIKKKLEKLL